MHPGLHDAWWRLATERQPASFPEALVSGFLRIGSIAYGAVVRLRNSAYDRGWARSTRLSSPVVSVGNLTVGGTGKTTCVELIARKLIAAGRRVAVLSRGYGGLRRAHSLQWEEGRLLIDGKEKESSQGLADEPQLLARHLEGVPIIVGARRDQTGRLACEKFSAEVVVLDDGFQHRQLQRDCEIALVSARMPLGGWALLPRGPMREGLDSLKRADVILITKADEALDTLGALREALRSFNPQALLVTAVHEPAVLSDALTGQEIGPLRLAGLRVGLVSSIGDPLGFEATVQGLQASVLWHQRWPDHHPYGAADWTVILERLRSGAPDALVTTEKDWVRLHSCVADRPPSAPLWVLGVRMKVLEGEELLNDRLSGLRVR